MKFQSGKRGLWSIACGREVRKEGVFLHALSGP